MFQKDDEYFWVTLSSRAEAARNPEAESASLRAITHLSRPEAEGFRSAFMETVVPVAVSTSTGDYLGTTLAYSVSFPRINRVAARIARGIFTFEHAMVLPEGYIATARALEGFEDGHDALRSLLERLRAAEPRQVGRVFTYRSLPACDDPCTTLAWFQIYEVTAFLGYTAKSGNNNWPEWV